MHPTAAGATPIPRRVLWFLVAEAVSAIGSWATAVVVWGYAAYKYDASASDIALFGVAFTVPGVLLGPISGTVIDRLGAIRTLAAAKVLGVAAALALLTADDFRTLALLCGLHGIAGAFSQPALQSLPPRLVDSGNLARTNALVSLTDELAIIVGPVVAGVGIALFGFKGAFLVDAATYALGLVVLPTVRLHAPVTDEPGEGAAPEEPVRLRDTFDGWRLVARTGVLRRVVSCTAAVHLLYGAALLAEPLYVRDTLERSEGVFAALQTVFGIFLVTGGLLAARVGERFASFPWIAAGVGLSGVTATIYLGTPFVAVSFIGVALWGVATALISGPSRTVLQRATPSRAHGRVLAADFVAANLMELIGVVVAGVAIDRYGVPWTITVLGSGVLVVALLLRRADRHDATRATTTASSDPVPVT
jgi:MFS family permease